MTPRERFFAMLQGKPVDRVPNLNILMLFAAKYIKQPYSAFCQDYRVMVEANAVCNEAFSIDLMSTMSDPFCETADYGAEVVFPHDDLPKCTRLLLSDIAEVDKVRPFDPWQTPRLLNRLNTVKLYKEKHGDTYPILGWVEGPLAEACDLRGINDAMVDLMEEDDFEVLLDKCVDQALVCAKAQLEAGADIIGVGDAAASIIGPTLYKEKVLAREKRLLSGIRAMGGLTKLHICGNINPLLPFIRELQPDILDIDYMVDMARAIEMFEGISVINGNINPVDVLSATPERVAELVTALKAVTKGRACISAGCEIPRDTPPENLVAFARALAAE